MVVIKECFPTQKEFIIEYLEKRKQQIEILKQKQIDISCYPCYEDFFKPFKNPSNQQLLTNDENQYSTELPIKDETSETKSMSDQQPNYIKNFNTFIQQTELHLNKILATNQRINDMQDIVQDIQKPGPQITPINSIFQEDVLNTLLNCEKENEYDQDNFQENQTITESIKSTKEKFRLGSKARKSESVRNLKTLQQLISRELASNENEDNPKLKLSSSLSGTCQKLRKKLHEPIIRIPSRSNSEKISLHYHGGGDSSSRPTTNRCNRNENYSLSSRLPSKEIRLKKNSSLSNVYKNGAQTDRGSLTEKIRPLKLTRSFIEPVAIPVSVINLQF